MNSQDESSQQNDHRLIFLRQMPRRMAALLRQVQDFQSDGWDASSIEMLGDQVRMLARASLRCELTEPAEQLNALEQVLTELRTRQASPDQQTGNRILEMATAITQTLDRMSKRDFAPQSPSDEAKSAADEAGAATPLEIVENPSPLRVCQLSDGNAMAVDLAARLEACGYEVLASSSIDTLRTRLQTSPPDMVLVDASRSADLAAIGQLRAESQKQHGKPHIALVAMASEDNMQSRLEGRRAGVDGLFFPPFKGVEILRQLQVLLTPATEERLRILIVEDDASQAMFAQGILNKAGMQTLVVNDPLQVLEALESLHPDLVLMDLYMPNADGVEVTALIREHPSFIGTPIVFLSGEDDADKRAEAINAGGDDFLSKPIRPTQLVEAVQNRIRRTRAMQHHGSAQAIHDPTNGLYKRAHVLEKINEVMGLVLAQHSAKSSVAPGGVLFLEIDGAAAWRDRLGYAVVDKLMGEAGRVLAGVLEDQHPATRINDYAFLILATDLQDSELEALANKLRNGLSTHPFEAGGQPVRLKASVGICPLRSGSGQAGALLANAEAACRDARDGGLGVSTFKSLQQAELDHQAALVQALRDAIGSGRFELKFQPIVSVQGATQPQFQTLVRWPGPSGRLLTATEILPLAESAGLLAQIDRWVLNHALARQRQVRDSGRIVHLFVPQAIATFALPDQPEHLISLLEKHAMAGSGLVLECRMADALLNPPALVAFVEALRSKSIRLCISQFELTADSARLLDTLRLSFIRLSPKYTHASTQKSLSAEMHKMIDHAHRVGAKVIGHPVEDAQTAAALWTSGIDFIQGNLLQGVESTLDFDFAAAVI